MMINLTIHHNIHLTREERYTLHNGNSVDTIGVSVPVWFQNRATTEPAKEVFCRYHLHNTREEKPILILEDGYEIVLPFRPKQNQSPMSDEEWLKLVVQNPDLLNAYYSGQQGEVSSKNLLDSCDGGGRTLIYREHNKIEKDGETLNVIHYVKLSDVESLLESLY